MQASNCYEKTYADGSRKFIKFCEWLGVDPFAVVAETTLATCALLFCHDCMVKQPGLMDVRSLFVLQEPGPP